MLAGNVKLISSAVAAAREDVATAKAPVTPDGWEEKSSCSWSEATLRPELPVPLRSVSLTLAPAMVECEAGDLPLFFILFVVWYRVH